LLTQNEPELVVARHEKEQRQISQLLRQQQEDAYFQSLRADREKEEKRKAEMKQELQKDSFAKEKTKVCFSLH
jgi:FAS-associated factor 2